MFNNTQAEETPKKKDLTVQQAIGIGIFVLGAIVCVSLRKIESWYYRNLEMIWYSFYAAVAGVAGFVIWIIRDKTTTLTDRVKLLRGLTGKDHSVLAGKTKDGVELHVPDKARTGHVQIIGSTGRGKTESVIIPWMARDIVDGKSSILIDGKGDPGIVDVLMEYFPLLDIQVFDLGNPENSCTTNPLKYGSPQQITDRIFTAFQFENEYYKSVQYDVTGTIVALLSKLGDVTFRKIYDVLTDDDKLSESVVEAKDPELEKRLTRFLSDSKELRSKHLSGLLSQLSPFAVGEVAHLVNGGPEEVTISDALLDITGLQTAAVFLIPTLKYQQIGHQLGKLLLQELGWAVGERGSRGGLSAKFVPVYLDEFSAFVYPGFSNILNKARSSQVALHLSHQSLGDLSIVSPEFGQIVTTNTNIKCILGLNDPVTADFFAKHLGTEKDEKLTQQAMDLGLWNGRENTGMISVREVEAYKVHPNELKNFMNGQGVLHVPTKRGNVTEVIQFERFSERSMTHD